ncbi:hypothetical protein FHT40_002594 [Mycolicibacterium sp. BK556]|uniref:hypothetical protein n=1 Tax=unclassified Mycolicibacterium TaxID=2636767 RepID=UPI0017A5863C|nr:MULTISPECIES: hypothetical protein [unclassified Mycolicibacterium]MBB3602933.1 hypothetical protein [Mycolicibacterium sp. BK556]MBB3633128.1 hypothetical protein [Mycolicibacterium sp. BK607]MBB3750678.1 hypothetical protein [Mycolicibacterium sp. BK634]
MPISQRTALGLKVEEAGLKSLVMTTALVASAVMFAPPATAEMYLGNYELIMPDRRDFHTWVWSAVTPCKPPNSNDNIPDCIHVLTLPRPIAKAVQTDVDAHLVNGQYTMAIDDPFGLRCGDIYYGPTIPTHDVYTWDANTLAGSMVSTFDAGCDGAPGGAFTYPFSLVRM